MTQDNKDIQPQVEPYIVKSHDIHIDADWIADIKSRYLFYAEKMEKLKQLVSVIGAKKCTSLVQNFFLSLSIKQIPLFHIPKIAYRKAIRIRKFSL